MILFCIIFHAPFIFYNINNITYRNQGIADTKVGTATVANVLTGKTFTNSSGVGLTGTMANNGSWNKTPTAKGKVTIPAGYHNGKGYVDTTSVYNAGVTKGTEDTKVGTATAANVLTGKTFTNSSGVGLSGTMANQGAWKNTPTAKGKVTIPAGYHNGSGYVDTTTVYNAGVTKGTTDTKVGTATAANVLTGKTFTNSSGVGLSGTMANQGAWTNTPTAKGKVTIPAGYHNGSGYVDTTTVYNKGVTDADARANANSANYKAGYNAGVTAADGRANANSANYQAGYNAGVANAKTTCLNGINGTSLYSICEYNKERDTSYTFSYTFTQNYDMAIVLTFNCNPVSISSSSYSQMANHEIVNRPAFHYIIYYPKAGDTITATTYMYDYYVGMNIYGYNLN